MRKLRVIVCRVGEPPKVEEIDDSLQAMQAVVGGWLTRVPIGGRAVLGRGIDLWADDEYLLKGYQPNRLVNGELPVYGDFFIAAHDDEETVSLTDEEIYTWLRRAAAWPMAIGTL